SASYFSEVWIRAMAASRSCSVISWRLICRSMFLWIVSSALPSCGSLISTSVTSSLASAQTWAIPLPMAPAPITPTFSIIRSAFRGFPALLFLKRLGEFRDRLEQVGHQSVIRHLEDRRVLVFVDGDDDLAVLHAGQMLNRARDADRDVEFRRHDLAGLADLVVVRHEARIDR